MDVLDTLARFFLRATVVLLALFVMLGGYCMIAAQYPENWGGVECLLLAVCCTLYLGIALAVSLFGTGVTRLVLRHRWVDEQYDRERFRNGLVQRHIITDYTPGKEWEASGARPVDKADPSMAGRLDHQSRHLNRAS
jgi:hypothetical protein